MCTLIVSCSSQPTDSMPKEITAKTIEGQLRQGPQLPFLDTIITVSDQNSLLRSAKPIKEREAEKLLYDAFKSKGILSRKELHIRSTISKEVKSVDYDTIYKIQCANLSGAVISYWLGPVDLNGHCFQPSKAIIQSTKKGYRIIKEDFIPTSFTIDSTKGTNIYGYEYECGGRGILRQFRITLR
jgi:hypothetical protein